MSKNYIYQIQWQASFPRSLFSLFLSILLLVNVCLLPTLAQEASGDTESSNQSLGSDELLEPRDSSKEIPESDPHHSKLDSLLEGVPDPKSEVDNSRLLNPQLKQNSYGSKDGLKDLDSLRIKRPDYGQLDSSKQTPGLPKVAPDIVKKSHPKVAPPRPGFNIDQASPSASQTRIKRPNVFHPSNLPPPKITNQIEPTNKPTGSTESSAIAKPNPTNSVKTVEPGDSVEAAKTGEDLVPGLMKQTPVLADPGTTKQAKDVSEPNPSDTDDSGGSVDITKVEEEYPMVGKLENLTFGTSNPELKVGDRLGKLENSIFARVFDEDSLFDRTERLKRTLLGVQAYDNAMSGDLAPTAIETLDPPLTGTSASESDFYYLDDMANMPDNLKAETPVILNGFAEELVNFERKKRNLEPLKHDGLIQKMADRQMESMIELKQLSHSGYKGQNPDRRYTKLGGVDAVTEGLVSASTADLHSSKLSKAAVCILLKKMLLRQDDREALLAPEATHLATSFGRLYNGTKIFGCTEVLTRRAKIELIGVDSRPGDKVEISGSVKKPYKFDRITIAWEEIFESPIEENPESDEALPYFPPLDYVAYSRKSEKDYSKAITALKALGVVAAIAGGVFVPPVALAAPLIVMAGPGGSELKPQSDIPVKGGVKVHGSSFKANIPLDNESQEGLYYVTVWASLGEGTKSFPVSRRAILVTKDDNDKKDSSQEISAPIEYTNESDDQTDSSLDKDKENQELDETNKPGI